MSDYIPWIIGLAIAGFAIFGGIRQSVQTRRSQAALASDNATARLRCEKSLHITSIDGNELYVTEIALVPGRHRIAFQVEYMGGIVPVPAADHDIPEGVTLAQWQGTTKNDMLVWLEPPTPN